VSKPINLQPPITGMSELLAELRETWADEIPICGPMGVQVVSFDEAGLAVSMPFEPNRNHQQTAFAGSLNTLCTLAGWGSTFLLTRRYGRRDGIVIRRGDIKYLRPVAGEPIVARCAPVDEGRRTHFLEMLAEKGQAKLDLDVRIDFDGKPAVVFHGSYVAFENR